MNRHLCLVLTFILALGCLGMGKGKSKHVVSFHAQVDPQFASEKRVFEWPAGSGYFYEKSPAIHQKQIRAFSAFDGDDGGWGAVFRLTTGGRNALRATVDAHPGKYLLAIVKGEPRTILKMDYMNDDGQIVVWEKLRPDDMEMLEKQYTVFE